MSILFNINDIKYIISNDLITKLYNLNFYNITKLGEGKNNIVLKVKYDNNYYALLINKNCQIISGYDKLLEYQNLYTDFNNYFIKLYDPIILKDTFLADNYCLKDQKIYVENLALYTLDQYLYNIKDEYNLEQKIYILKLLKQRLYNMILYSTKLGLYSNDYHPGNFAFANEINFDNLVFIDIESFDYKNKIESEHYVKRIVDKFITYYIMHPIYYNNEFFNLFSVENNDYKLSDKYIAMQSIFINKI
jgi:hypothetical protein